MANFPNYTQLDAMDCGPTSLQIVAAFYGKHYSLQTLRERCHISREGVSLLGISDASEQIGFRSTGVKLTWEQLRDEANLPCIVHWNQQHFVVVYKIAKELVSLTKTQKGSTQVALFFVNYGSKDGNGSYGTAVETQKVRKTNRNKIVTLIPEIMNALQNFAAQQLTIEQMMQIRGGISGGRLRRRWVFS